MWSVFFQDLPPGDLGMHNLQAQTLSLLYDVHRDREHSEPKPAHEWAGWLEPPPPRFKSREEQDAEDLAAIRRYFLNDDE